uniref:30S ribosomal protein S3 n=1 Tax=uncultured organism TaxID=155900 RepID=U3GVY1_9ZZZZ|nr:30S ribosomal protein S3 [uncultured organism]
MGHKVNPKGFRLGPVYSWDSLWYADKTNYQHNVLEDLKVREFLLEKLKSAGVTKIELERSVKKIKIKIHVSRPGVVIGRGGSNIELLKKETMKLLKINPKDPGSPKLEFEDIVEVKNPDISAILIVERLKDQLAKRYPHRRAVAQALEKASAAGAKGIKIVLSGRIGGAEIGRTEKYTKGSVPTQTLRADIDYHQSPALTKSGYVGIKVWVFKGETATI